MDIPRAPGTYALLICLPTSHTVTVGNLGTFELAAGWYMYAGSARGPGGLHARLSRHARAEKRPHWHIDYLLQVARLISVWYVVSNLRLECHWADALSSLPDTHIPVAGFGASDCRCAAHLLYVERRPGNGAVLWSFHGVHQALGISDLHITHVTYPI